MAVTVAGSVGARQRYHIICNIEGKVGAVPRSMQNHDFQKLVNSKEVIIDKNPNRYCSFPFCIEARSGKVFVMYSASLAHADSAEQRLGSIDIATETTDTGSFVDFHSTANPGVYNASPLNSFMADGENVLFKNYHIHKNSNNNFTISPVTLMNGLNSYVGRSLPKIVSGWAYRVGTYTVDVNNSIVGLFRSNPTDLLNWTWVCDIFSVPGTRFTEGDIAVFPRTGEWVAFCRDSTQSSLSGTMHWSRSLDGGVTWAAPIAGDRSMVNGVQPRLAVNTRGDLLLFTGDRVGSSGYDYSGDQKSNMFDKTGTCAYRLDKDATDTQLVNWGWRTPITSIYSTDGGQLFPILIPGTDRFVGPSYGARSGKTLAALWCDFFDSQPM